MLTLEILEFYDSKNLQIAKLIDKRPYGITREEVEAAAVKVFNDIQGGADIKDVSISRAVWAAAKGIKADVYHEDRRIIAETRKVLDEKDDAHEKMRLEIIDKTQRMLAEKDAKNEKLMSEKYEAFKKAITTISMRNANVLEERDAKFKRLKTWVIVLIAATLIENIIILGWWLL